MIARPQLKLMLFVSRKLFFNPGVLALSLLLNLCHLTAQESRVESTPLFNGKDLSGWKTSNPADRSLWKVVDSVIVGGDGITQIKANTFLQTEKEYGDFELRCLFRLSGGTGFINSGIQYRSILVDGHLTGYQADIGDGYWGDIYDEHRRGKLVGGDLRTLRHLLRSDGWNSYIVRVKGNHHELYINGIKVADYTEKDASIPKKGVIGFQLHGGGAAKLELRDISINLL